jgi:hypothetical protein
MDLIPFVSATRSLGVGDSVCVSEVKMSCPLSGSSFQNKGKVAFTGGSLWSLTPSSKA